jgi:hypothetical protein
MVKNKKSAPDNPLAVVQNQPNIPMTLGDAFSKIMLGQGQTLENILVDLINQAKVDMITDIQQPRNLTRIEIIGATYTARGFPKCGKMLESFSHIYKVNMVSHKRGSRTEMRDMISAGLQREKSLEDKLEKTQ